MIAGGGVRAVLELAGISDVLSKSLGSQNPINLVKATVNALQSLRDPRQVAELRGLTVAEVLGIDHAKPEASAELAEGVEVEETVEVEEAVSEAAGLPAEESIHPPDGDARDHPGEVRERFEPQAA